MAARISPHHLGRAIWQILGVSDGYSELGEAAAISMATFFDEFEAINAFGSRVLLGSFESLPRPKVPAWSIVLSPHDRAFPKASLPGNISHY